MAFCGTARRTGRGPSRAPTSARRASPWRRRGWSRCAWRLRSRSLQAPGDGRVEAAVHDGEEAAAARVRLRDGGLHPARAANGRARPLRVLALPSLDQLPPSWLPCARYSVRSPGLGLRVRPRMKHRRSHRSEQQPTSAAAPEELQPRARRLDMVRSGSSAWGAHALCARCADVEARARRQDRAATTTATATTTTSATSRPPTPPPRLPLLAASDADAGSGATGVEQAPARAVASARATPGRRSDRLGAVAGRHRRRSACGGERRAGEELAADAPSNASVVGSASVDGRRPDPALAEQRTVVWVEVEAAATALYDGAGVAGTHPDDAWSTMTVADGSLSAATAATRRRARRRARRPWMRSRDWSGRRRG